MAPQEYVAKQPVTVALEYTGENAQEIIAWANTFPELAPWGGSMAFRLSGDILECRWASESQWNVVQPGYMISHYPGADGLQASPAEDFLGQWEPKTA